MGRLRFARLAENDLAELANYIALDNREAAHSFVKRLREICHRLAPHPDIGVMRPRFKGGDLRSYPVGQYMIFYRKVDRGVEIARILHGARDVDALLG